MDPSKVTLTKEDIRERLGLLQSVIEGRQARVRDALDAVTNAVLEGTLESARSLAKGLHEEETALDRVVQQRTRLEAALVTAADDPGETSGLEGHVMGHLEDPKKGCLERQGESHTMLWTQPGPDQRDREVTRGQQGLRQQLLRHQKEVRDR
jgi:hypothetical protein